MCDRLRKIVRPISPTGLFGLLAGLVLLLYYEAHFHKRSLISVTVLPVLLTLIKPGLSLDILKMESRTDMGRTANIIIKEVIHIFASISKIMRILLMGRRNRERCKHVLRSSHYQFWSNI